MMTFEPEEFAPIDGHFARLFTRLGANPLVADAALRLSAAQRAGHTCVPLAELHPQPALLANALRASPLAGAPGHWRPLILDAEQRLYFQRAWQYEQALAARIQARLAQPPEKVDTTWFDPALDRLLPSKDPATADQRAAVRAALTHRFTVITGGPGTGKTRTVSVILALLQEQTASAGAPPLRIALAAPTGKAAARLSESLNSSSSSSSSSPPVLPAPPSSSETAVTGIAGAGPNGGSSSSSSSSSSPPPPSPPPPSATTLHRLLGLSTGAALPRFDPTHPLPVDLVIVDEASMIDLALMAKLFAAVPETARLILLGDRDQLASVEAGHVLGEMGAALPSSHCLALTRNFRFPPESGIHQLSASINAGHADAALALLTGRTSPEIGSAPLPAPGALPALLRTAVLGTHAAAVAASTPDAALRAINASRILCAVRRGPYGVEHLNRLAESALLAAGQIQTNSRNYPGRPVMILQNDYHLGLFNGDVGILLPDPAADGDLRAFFPSADPGAPRSIHPARLPEHETVWAMTVHKSQGSEFDQILLLLPDRDSPLLSRELLYTAITRARRRVDLRFHAPILRTAIARRTTRYSGLRDLLQSK